MSNSRRVLDRFAQLAEEQVATGSRGRKRDRGMAINVGDLLDTFLTNGKKEFSRGTLIVPDDFRFAVRSLESGKMRFDITSGYPRFDGKVLGFIPVGAGVRYLDLLNNAGGNAVEAVVIGVKGWLDITMDVEW